MSKGHYLEQWIALSGLNQAELGDKCGYERTHFNKIVAGKNKLSREKAVIIAKALTEHLGRTVQPADLFRIPHISKEAIDAPRPIGNNTLPMGKEARMLELARPMIKALVEQLGLEVVIREAVEASNRGEAIHPLQRKRT